MSFQVAGVHLCPYCLTAYKDKILKGVVMKLLRFLLILIYCFFFITCNGTNSNNQPPSGTEDNVPVSGPRTVIFSIPEGHEQVTDYYVMNISDGYFEHDTLIPGENIIELPDSGIYSIGLVSDLDASQSSKSISSAISSLGSIKIIAADLDSLPLDVDSTQEINLGNIEIDIEGGSVSAHDSVLSDIAADTGYSSDTLEGFGNWDNVLNKFQNVDIDKNGIWDDDETIDWSFDITNYFEADYSKINFDENNWEGIFINFKPIRISVYLELGDDWIDNFGVGPDTAFLILPEDLEIIGNGVFDYEGSNMYQYWDYTLQEEYPDRVITEIPSRYVELHNFDDILCCFDFDLQTNIYPPYQGNYKLRLSGHDDLYYFDAMEFTNYDSEVAELLFPVTWVKMDNERRLEQIEYYWIKVDRNGNVFTPTLGEISLIARDLYLSIPNNEDNEGYHSFNVGVGSLSGSITPETDLYVGTSPDGDDFMHLSVGYTDGSNYSIWYEFLES